MKKEDKKMTYEIREKDGVYYVDCQAGNGTVLLGQQSFSDITAAENYVNKIKNIEN